MLDQKCSEARKAISNPKGKQPTNSLSLKSGRAALGTDAVSGYQLLRLSFPFDNTFMTL